MYSHNIQYISSQLKAIAESIGKIAKGINNPWTIWVPILTTLFLGFIAIFIAIFQDKVRYWINKPKLNASFKEPAAIITDRSYYGGNKYYKFVFEIKNTGKSTLEDAEALITDIWELNEGEKKLNPMPFNLTWSQKGGTTIPKIPSNTYKFFNFGDILKPEPNTTGFTNYASPSSIEFKFVDKKEVNLKSGKYKIRIEFSGNNIDPLIKTYKLTLNNKWADNPDNIKEMVSIE